MRDRKLQYPRSHRTRLRHKLLCVAPIGLALLLSGSARAELQTYQIFFQPSASSDAAGYTLHFGVEPSVYQTEFDIGSPPVSGGTIVYAADLETANDLYVAARAYDANGSMSAFSNEIRVAAAESTSPPAAPAPSPDPSPPPAPAPTPDPEPVPTPEPAPAPPASLPGIDGVRLGLSTDATGWIHSILEDGSSAYLTLDSLAADRDLRPARCDLDEDGDADLILGFGPGSDGRIALLLLENDAVFSVESIQAGDSRYHTADGQTHPACGDVDGDGRVEIVVGFGPAAQQRLQIFDDSASGYAPFVVGSAATSEGMLAVPVSDRVSQTGASLFPAVGDIDGDGRDEIVVGMGLALASDVVLLDDATEGFRQHDANPTGQPWIRIATTEAFLSLGDSTRPTVGDFDGDGLDEVAIGFGAGSGGWIAFFDDAQHGFSAEQGEFFMIPAGRDEYRRTDGETRPCFGDIDGDGREELVVGFARDGAFELQVFEDIRTAGMQLANGSEEFISAPDPGAVWIASPAP